MAYDTNPKLPALRARAVDMVRDGKSVSEVARYFGFSKGAVSKWCKKAPIGGVWAIPTASSAPKSHPRKLDEATAYRIKELRLELKGRCAQVIKAHLEEEGLQTSVRTIQRTLERFSLLKKYGKWKKLHISGERPKAQFPGDLVEIDTIHISINQRSRLYVYTLIDVATRYAFARAELKATTGNSVRVVDRAKKYLPFEISCMQSDHGPEFGQYFTDKLGLRHRHSRVRRPNDNAHLERFNRTIQQELLNDLPKDVNIINRRIPGYLRYYNERRKHLGLELLTPAEAVRKCFQGHVV